MVKKITKEQQMFQTFYEILIKKPNCTEEEACLHANNMLETYIQTNEENTNTEDTTNPYAEGYQAEGYQKMYTNMKTIAENVTTKNDENTKYTYYEYIEDNAEKKRGE
jgi:hypothetical protein